MNLNSSDVDPIRRLWVFHPSALHRTVDHELRR